VSSSPHHDTCLTGCAGDGDDDTSAQDTTSTTGGNVDHDLTGLTTNERARMAELERENRELGRANEILKRASAFFAAELDRPHR
jgi:transposase-like protein